MDGDGPSFCCAKSQDEGLDFEMSSDTTEKDLPLLSNVDCFRVFHYILNLECDVEKKIFTGCIVLFLDHTLEGSSNDAPFQTVRMILDCCDIEVDTVLASDVSDPRQFLKTFTNIETGPRNCLDMTNLLYPLSFKVEKWCLLIWNDDQQCMQGFPKVIQIYYKTKPKGKSLKWTIDQDGNPCVFTVGAWINNRSLFPCQEPPIAMATWQAVITARVTDAILATGDMQGIYVRKNEASTFALAVGQWEKLDVITCPVPRKYQPSFCEHQSQCPVNFHASPTMPTRLFAPLSILHKADEIFNSYIPSSLQAVRSLLGPHPFLRLDILIVPPCFASMGLASPNLMFLSQSVLHKDMQVRFSHEICHSWFGLIIGALDWTEEWLSEGLATFMEDKVHAEVMQFNERLVRETQELLTLWRYKTLMSELENTDTDLQVLRPRGSNPQTEGQLRSIKNGMNTDKAFTQVHYLKGYFLLLHLADVVGNVPFKAFMKRFVQNFHSQLVTSNDFLNLYFECFPKHNTAHFNTECIASQWLDQTGSVNSLQLKKLLPSRSSNHLYDELMEITESWRLYDSRHKTKCRTKCAKKRKFPEDADINTIGQKMTYIQLVLMLENLLEEKSMHRKTLYSLNKTYVFTECHAEVQHRWFELVIKHRYKECYNDIEAYIIHHQAMGVYLHCEMANSGCPLLMEKVQNCYTLLCEDMDENTKKTIYDLLNPNWKLDLSTNIMCVTVK